MTIELLPERTAPAELNDPLSGSLCHELRKTSVTVMTAMSSEFAQWNLKPSEANLLKYVGANRGCTQNEIARAFRSSATNLVPLVARLERDGLLERAPGGGRAIALSLSEKGDAVLAGVNAGFDLLEDTLGANLTAQEAELVIEALRKIRKAACHYGKAEHVGG